MQKKTKELVWMIFRFAMIMMFIGLVLGVYGREITRPLMKAVDLDRQVLVQQWVMLTHGHALLYGMLIPLALASGVYMFRADLEKDFGGIKSLRKAFVLYCIGAVLMLGLSIYKGTMYVLTIAGDPSLTLEAVDAALFGGSIMIRSIVYTLVHPLYAAGLVWFFLRIRKSVRKSGK